MSKKCKTITQTRNNKQKTYKTYGETKNTQKCEKTQQHKTMQMKSEEYTFILHKTKQIENLKIQVLVSRKLSKVFILVNTVAKETLNSCG